MTFPNPVISVAIEPKTKVDQEKLGTAIQKLAEEDPTFQVHTDEETGQTIIAGMGELHLEVLVDRMRREFKVEANVGKPQVAYRETIRAGREVPTTPTRSRPVGRASTPRCIISLEPRSRATATSSSMQVTGGRIPKEYIPSVDPVSRRPCSTACSPATRSSGHQGDPARRAYHDVDSSEMAFKIAGSMAFKEAVRKADPALLEPMMAVEVTTPDDYMGDVIGDINSRRGQIQSMEERGAPGRPGSGPAVGDVRLRRRPAVARPRAERDYSMQFDSTREVPKNVADEIIKKTRGECRRVLPKWLARHPSNKERHVPSYRSNPRRTRQARVLGGPQWRRQSSSGPSRTSTSAPSVTSTTGRRR
jgi:elongation factor G